MDESVKKLIGMMLKEALDFILSIPSFSINNWKIFLPLYTALIAYIIYEFKIKTRL